MSAQPGVRDFDRLPHIARETTRAEWATVVGVWLFLVLRSVAPTTESFRLSGIPTSHWPTAVHIAFEVLVWLAATPLLFAALDRTPVVRGHRVRNFVLRLALTGVAVVTHAALSRGALFVLVSYLGADARLYTSDVLSFRETLRYSAEGFLLVLLAHVVIQRVHRSRYRQRRTAELESSLTRARLHALSKELQPHFLFNTLNAIAALVPDDPRLAEAMLVRLGDLLRITLDEGTEGEISLRLELERLDLYLDLQQMRFGPRLIIRRDVAPDVLQAQIPAMLLQPLVENALTHGIGPKPGPGEIGISASRVGDRLRIMVHDTGLGLPSHVRESTGIRNTRERLAAMFPDAYRFALEPRRDGAGTVVTIEIPLRTSPEAAEATAEHNPSTTDPPSVPTTAGAVR